jgi:hypothetical protein
MAWSLGWPAGAVPSDYVLDDAGSWPVVLATFRAA